MRGGRVAWWDDAVDLVWLAVDPIFLRRRDQLNECGFSPAAGRDRVCVICDPQKQKIRTRPLLLSRLELPCQVVVLFV